MANTRVTPAVPNNGDLTHGEEPATVGEEVLAWSVGAVAERLDLATSTLRTWDRRYGIGPSQRTGGGHRRYDEVDIQRVRLMAQLTGRGVPASTAARVATSIDAPALASALGPGPAGSSLGRQGSMSTVEAIVSSAAALEIGRASCRERVL